MVRLGISVEGTCEEKFVKQVLAPYLLNKNILITPVSMGGAVNLDRVKSELKKFGSNFDYVTTLYDFYGFQKKSPNETRQSLEAKIQKHVHAAVAQKLIPYVQLYEFEGLLFSAPDCIADVLNNASCADWAKKVLNEFNNDPESINNSVETAPSKRLEKNTKYRKTTHGPKIAAAIGIDNIRAMCKGFDKWLSGIERLSA